VGENSTLFTTKGVSTGPRVSTWKLKF